MKTYSSVPGRDEDQKIIVCPLCGAEKFKKKWTVGDSSFVSCRSCGLIYQNPQPVLEDLVDRYDQEYFNYEVENQDGFLELMLLGLKDVDFPLEPENEGFVFLDVGCATGALLEEMNRRKWKGQGIEVCKESALYAKENRSVVVFCGTLEDWDAPRDSLTVFHSSHVIEHLVDPKAFVYRAFELLKPGGYFICTTPNASGLQSRWFGPKWRSAIEDHICLFNKRQLKNLLIDQGFRILKQKSWGGLAQGAGRPFLKKILDPMAKKMNFGDVMIFLAQKPL